MKTNCITLGIILLCFLLDASAQYGRRRNYYVLPPVPGTNQNQTGTAKAPVEKSEQFKNVPVNTIFFFAADKNKSFPRTKVSETTAKSVKDGSVSKVPAATPVIVENKNTNSASTNRTRAGK